MENCVTLTFRIFTTVDQRSTLMQLHAMTKSIVFEAILRQRAYLRGRYPTGQVEDFGRFDRFGFLDEFMEDKGFIKPFDQLHVSLLLGAVKIAENIITQPEHTNKETKKKIPGLYQFASKGGVSFAFNAKVNNRMDSPLFTPVTISEKRDSVFYPECRFDFPHLGELRAHAYSKEFSTYAINTIFEDYIPLYGRFTEVVQTSKNENFWSLAVTFIRKELFNGIDIKLQHVNLDVEPVTFPCAYTLRKKRLAEESFRDHTSCRSDPSFSQVRNEDLFDPCVKHLPLGSLF